MATGKRYYWIKLKDSFLTSDTVDYLMSQTDGANYVVLYQMLLLKTINTEGRLERRIGEVIIPYDINKIQRDCKWFTVDTIRVALELYKQFGLIYESNDGVLVMADHDRLVGSETDYAEQKKLQRQKEALLMEGVDNVHSNVHIDIRDKEIRDKDIRDIDNRDNNKRFIPPTVEEVKAYCVERGNRVDSQRFVDFYESKGWKVGNSKMKDWKASVRTWERGDNDRTGNISNRTESNSKPTIVYD